MLLEAHQIAHWRTSRAGDASELVLSWPEDRAMPRRRAVTVRARATLAHRVHQWTFQAGQLPDAGELVVVPEIPVEAQLDPLAADYVVDLLLTVVIDGTPITMEPAWLAWPDGLDGAPVVWTPELGQTLAPHGVLDDEVVALADEMGVQGRLLAPIVQLRSRPEKPDPAVVDGWIDTGLYAAGGAQ
jgi:hypothetical protein